MANEKPLYTLYKGLKSSNYDVPDSYERFERAFTSGGNGGVKQAAENRHALYKSLKEQNYDVPDTYEHFYTTLFEPVNSTTSRAKTGSMSKPKPKPNPGGMSAADRAAFVSGAQDIIRKSKAGLRRTENQMDYTKGNAGLKVKPVRLGQNTKVVKRNADGTLAEQHPVLDMAPQKQPGQTFVTESGNEYDNRADADIEQNAIDQYNYDNSLDGQLNNAYAERDRLDEALKKRRAELEDKPWWRKTLEDLGKASHSGLDPNATANDPEHQGYENDEEYMQLMSAARKNHQTIQTLEDKKNGKMNNFWHAFGTRATNGYTFADGLPELRDATALEYAKKHIKVINEKQQKGLPLTRQEQAAEAVLRANETDDAVQSMYGNDYDAWSRAGGMMANSVDFMKDFLLMPGGASMAKGIASKVAGIGGKALAKTAGESALKAMPKAIARATLKATGVLLGAHTAGAAISNATGIGRTAALMGQKAAGSVTRDENGNYKVENEQGLMHALASAEREQARENGSEMFGEFLPGGKLLGGLAKKGLEKIGLSKVSNFLTQMGNKEWYKRYSQFLKTGGYNGIPGEAFEEYEGELFDALTGHAGDAWKDFTDAKQNTDIWLGCATMGALMGAIPMGIHVGGYYKFRHDMNKADKVASFRISKDKWEPLKEELDNTDNGNMADVVTKRIVMNDDLNPQEKKAALDYVRGLTNFRGFNIAQASNAGDEESQASQAQNDAYSSGYNTTDAASMNDAKNVVTLAQQKLDAIFGEHTDAEQILNAKNEDGTPYFTANDRKVAQEAVNAQQQYEGMLQRVRDDIDDEVQQTEAIYDSRTNKDGIIQQATLKEQTPDGKDKRVFVTSGNVVMTDDGKGINTEKSDSSVVVINEDGKVQMISPEDIFSMDTPLDGAQAKQQAIDAIKQSKAQEAADQIDGKVSLAPGSTYNVTVNGQPAQATVIADPKTGAVQNADGMVNVSVNGQATAMAPEQLQQMVDQTNMQRTASSFNQDGNNESMPSGRLVSKQNPQLSDEVFVVDENGDPVHGVVTQVDPVTGEYMVKTDKAVSGKTVQPFQAGELYEMVPDDGARKDAGVDNSDSGDRNYNDDSIGRGNIFAKNIPNDSESAQQQDDAIQPIDTQQPAERAIDRIPKEQVKDKQGNVKTRHHWEQADPGDTWDALNEQYQDEQRTQHKVSIRVNKIDKQIKDVDKQIKKLDDSDDFDADFDDANGYSSLMEKKMQLEAQKGYWQSVLAVPQQRKLDDDKSADEEKAAKNAAQKQAMAEAMERARQEREAVNGVPDVVKDIPSDARKRGFRNVNGMVVERQQATDGVTGRESNVKFSTADTAKGHIRVINADQLQPSHVGGQRNPSFFIDEAQPKDRSDAVSSTAAEKIASGLNPEEITGDGSAYQFSAPTVNSRGEVIQGNNRSDALKLMWSSPAYEKAQTAYKQYIADHAEEFGFTPEDVEKIQQMKHPVMVNELDVNDDDAIRLGQMKASDNESGGVERIDPVTTSQKLGSKVGSFANVLLSSEDEDASLSDVMAENGGKAVKWLATQGAISDTAAQSAFDKKGNLTPEARMDLQNILKQSLFQGGVSDMSTMFDKMPAKAQKAILSTFMRDFDSADSERILPEIQKAIEAWYDCAMSNEAFAKAPNYKAAKAAMRDWESQTNLLDDNMPSDKFSNFAMELACRMQGCSMRETQQNLNDFFDLVQGKSQGDLFGGTTAGEQADRQEAICRVFNIEYKPINNKNNGEKRSNDLDADRGPVREGGPGGAADDKGRERAESRGGEADAGGRDTEHPQGQGEDGGYTDTQHEVRTANLVGKKYTLSEQVADNGEHFYQDKKGNVDLVDVPQEVFDAIDYKKAPLRLTPSMILHMIGRHGKETGVNDVDKSIDFILDVMNHFDHVRLGYNGALVFSIENGRDKTGRRAISILLSSKTGDFYGIVSSGYEGVDKLKKRPQLWAGSANITPALDSATKPVTTLDAQQGGEQIGSASGQRGLSIETVAKTEPQQRNNAISTGSSLSADKDGGIMSAKPNGKPTVSAAKFGLHPMPQNGESVPLGDSNKLTSTDSQPALLGVNSPESSAAKVGNSSESGDKKSENVAEGEENSNNSSHSGHNNDRLGTTSTLNEVETERQGVNTEPSEKQKEAGNYKKGHIKVDGYDITIENPKGSTRSGKDASGKAWSVPMHYDYGYIKGTEGVDGDHIDVYLSDNPTSGNVYVVDQVNQKDGSFDEHKVMYGFPSKEAAVEAYKGQYEKGWKVGTVTEVSREDFKKWVESSKRKIKPFSEYKIARTTVEKEQRPAEPSEELDSKPLSVEEAEKRVRGISSEMKKVSEEVRSKHLAKVAKKFKLGDKSSVTPDWVGGLDSSQRKTYDRLERAYKKELSQATEKLRIELQEAQLDLENAQDARHSDEVRKKFLDSVNPKKDSIEARVLSAIENGEGYDFLYDLPSEDVAKVKDYSERLAKTADDMLSKDESDAAFEALNYYSEEANDILSRLDNSDFETVEEDKSIVDKTGRYHLGQLVTFKGKNGIVCGFNGMGEVLVKVRNGGFFAISPDDARLAARRDTAGSNQPVEEPHFQKSDSKTPVDRSEAALRDGLRDVMREAGIPVIDDAEEGQRVLDMANSHARMMSFGEPYDYEKYPLGRVEPGISNKEVGVVAASANHGFANYKEAKAWAKENVAKTYTTEETGGKGEVRISNGAVDKFLSQSAVDKSDSKDVHLAVLKVLPDVLKESIDVETHPDFLKGRDGKRSADNGMNRDVLVHRCYGAVSIDGKLYRVKITLKEDVRNKDLPSNTHSYEATKIELLAGTLVKPEGDNPNTNNSIPVANLLKNVGLSYNPSEKVLAASEKRTKSIREQRVYHGSVNDFDAFDTMNHLSEGEGNQAFGAGTYVADQKDLGVQYANIAYDNNHIKQTEHFNAKRLIKRFPTLESFLNSSKTKGAMAKNGKTEAEAKAYYESQIKLAEPPRLLYTVEIPNDNGKNYLDWDGELNRKQADTIRKRLYETVLALNDDYKGAEKYLAQDLSVIKEGSHIGDTYGTISDYLGSDKAASEFLHDLGYTGIKVHAAHNSNDARYKDNWNYVIFNDKDLKITDKVRFFRTTNGEAYGFTVGGKIYIDPRIATSETPIHEYAHLWAEALRKANPKEWQNVVGLMKECKDVWEQVKSEYPELDTDDEIADEVLAHYSGKRGAERLRTEAAKAVDETKGVLEKAEVVSAFSRLKDAIKKAWKHIAEDVLHIHFTNADEVADKVMYDLLNKVNPKVHSQIVEERTEIERKAKEDGSWMKAPNGQESNLSEDQWVTVRTKQFKDWFGDWEEDPEESSQAVDENGEPKVFYHNTDNDFTVFDANRNGTHTDAGWLGDGFYFYGDENEGDGYGHKKMEVFLNVRNMYYATSTENEELADANDREKSIAFRNEIENEGYDGVYYNGDLRQEAVVFYPEQIKSATDNVGTYDAANPDIRYEKKADRGYRKHRSDSTEDVEAVNKRFNEELQEQIDGQQEPGHIYQLGKPSPVLLSTGIPDLPIQLSATRLKDKATSFGHDYALEDVKGLVKALQHPLAVFAYGNKEKAQNVIVELEKDGKNFIVGLSLRPVVNGRVLEINSIRNVFPKNNSEWLNWISQGKALYIDKKKVQDLINKQRTILADVDYLDLNSVAKIINSFENPVIKDENLSREGVGAYSDDELSLTNDPVSIERRNMEVAVKNLAERLHLGNVEIRHSENYDRNYSADSSNRENRREGGVENERARAKGYYSRKSGKIVINIDNHQDAQDAAHTLLHEAVAHYGLRQLFGEHFETFLQNVYEAADKNVRRKIVDLALHKYVGNFETATEEYLASLAEQTDFENLPHGFWTKIKELFLKMLHAIGFEDFAGKGVTLSDNELRYILWRSYENLKEPGRYRSILGEAEDVAKQYELKVGNYSGAAAMQQPTQPSTTERHAIEQQPREREQEAAEGDGVAEALSARAEEIRNMPSVSITQHDTSREYVREQYNKLGTAINKRDGKKVTFYHGVFGKMWRGEDSLFAKIAPQLKDLFESSIYGFSSEDLLAGKKRPDGTIHKAHRNIDNYDYYVGKASINGKDYYVRFTVQNSEMRGNSGVHDVMVTDVSIYENSTGDASTSRRITGERLVANGTISDAKLMHLFGFDVNNSEKNADTQENVSEPAAWGKKDLLSKAEQISHGIEPDLLFRDTIEDDDDTARETYNAWADDAENKIREAWQDSMINVRNLQEAVLKQRGEKMEDWEDAYNEENRSHGQSRAESEYFTDNLYKPLLKAVNAVAKAAKVSIGDVTEYMMAKHGLERNEVFARRDAQAAYDKAMEKANGTYDALMKAANAESDSKKKDALEKQAQKVTFPDFDDLYQHFRLWDYAGLTDLTGQSDVQDAEVEAKRIVDEMEKRAGAAAMQRPTQPGGLIGELWKATNEATGWTLEKAYESGIISKDNYEQVSRMFNYYIPLRGWDETTADDLYDYVGSGDKGTAFSPTVHKAKGRRSQADNPIAYIGSMAVSAIVQGNKNKVKQTFMRFVENHPTNLVTVSEMWYRNYGTDTAPDWREDVPNIPEDATADEIADIVKQHEDDMKRLEAQGLATKERGRLHLGVPVKQGQALEHHVEVLVNGKKYVLYINGNPRAAQALNGTRMRRASERSFESSKIAAFGRKLAERYTSLSPSFTVSNAFRDLTMAAISTAIKESPAYALRFRLNVARLGGPVRMFTLMKWYNDFVAKNGVDGANGLNGASETQRYFYEFMTHGAETGFTSLKEIDEYKDDMQKMYKNMNQSVVNPKRLFRGLSEGLEYTNRCIEDMTRFAIYMASRQSGRSVRESTSDAKNITLNFNRKGSGEMGNATYRNLQIFVNPAIQSLQNVASMAMDHPVKFTLFTGAVALIGAAQVFATQLLWSLFGGGDGDDKDKWNAVGEYWKLPSWQRRNNLVMWIPGTRKFAMIPLAQEFRVFHGFGETLTTTLQGKSDENAALELMSQVGDLLPLDFAGNNGNMLINLAPTVTQPLLQVGFNTDFTGRPLYKDNDFNKYEPSFQKAYVGTPSWLIKSSEMINDLTGGDEHKQGWWERTKVGGELNNPAVVDHLLKGYYGGLYSFLAQTGGAMLIVVSGKLPDVQEVPIANRLVTAVRETQQNGKAKLPDWYYEMSEDSKRYQSEVSGYRRDMLGNKAGSKEYFDAMIKTQEFAKQEQIKELMNNINQIRAAQATVEDPKTKEDAQTKQELSEGLQTCLGLLDKIRKKGKPLNEEEMEK